MLLITESSKQFCILRGSIDIFDDQLLVGRKIDSFEEVFYLRTGSASLADKQHHLLR